MHFGTTEVVPCYKACQLGFALSHPFDKERRKDGAPSFLPLLAQPAVPLLAARLKSCPVTKPVSVGSCFLLHTFSTTKLFGEKLDL
jgi:hypothetical protein